MLDLKDDKSSYAIGIAEKDIYTVVKKKVPDWRVVQLARARWDI